MSDGYPPQPPLPPQPQYPPQPPYPPQPLQPLAPTPLPAAPAPRTNTSKIVLVIVGVIVALCACCAVANVVVPLGVLTVGPKLWTGTTSTYWSSDGRYAIVQGTDRGGKLFSTGDPIVVVYDTQTATTRKLPDHVVVAVEPAAPRVWVRPDSARSILDAASDASVGDEDQAGDVFFAEPQDVRIWDLDAPGTYLELPVAAWTPWPGPTGGVAHLGIVPSYSADPDSLAFEWETTGTVPVERSSMGPFYPLGWSPSGRYFALVPLQQLANYTDRFDIEVYDTVTGALVDEAAFDAMYVGRLSEVAAWHPTRDVMLVMRTGDSYVVDETSVSGDTVAEWDPVAGTQKDADFARDTLVLSFVGRGEKGLYVRHQGYSAERVSVLADDDELKLVASLPPLADSVAMSPHGALLVLAMAGADSPAWMGTASVGSDPNHLTVFWDPETSEPSETQP